MCDSLFYTVYTDTNSIQYMDNCMATSVVFVKEFQLDQDPNHSKML